MTCRALSKFFAMAQDGRPRQDSSDTKTAPTLTFLAASANLGYAMACYGRRYRGSVMCRHLNIKGRVR